MAIDDTAKKHFGVSKPFGEVTPKEEDGEAQQDNNG
jgi:hypothetical protein